MEGPARFRKRLSGEHMYDLQPANRGTPRAAAVHAVCKAVRGRCEILSRTDC